ncbi:MAG: methionyl-tRNA formyltransferase, partial [Halanaerobiales bacterium]
MKILFMGGHELGKITLENLIEKRKKIVGVITPDTKSDWYSGVDKIANQYNLPLYKENNINSKEFIKTIDKINPDLIVSVNFNQIIGKEILSIPKNESINVHASLLPKYRGRAPLNWAIINGEEVTGVTVHYIDEGIDTGDIILQNEIRINEDDYIEDILNKVKEIYPLIVNKAVDQIQKGLVNSIPQKHDDG